MDLSFTVTTTALTAITMVLVILSCSANEITAIDYDAVCYGLAYAESLCDPDAVGDNGKAIGAYQIHPIYVKDVNRILGRQEYTPQDRWSQALSKEMVLVYLKHYGTEKRIGLVTPEKLAMLHNRGCNHWQPETKAHHQYLKRFREGMIAYAGGAR